MRKKYGKSTNIPPLGHDWDEGVVTLEPGTDSKGIKTYTCKHDPSHLYTECIDPAGDETSGSETKPAENSGADQNKNASDTSGAAAQTSGNKAAAYTPASSGTVVSAKTASAKTGDRDYSYVWIIAAAGAAGAAAIAAVIVKKRKKTG